MKRSVERAAMRVGAELIGLLTNVELVAWECLDVLTAAPYDVSESSVQGKGHC